MLNDWKVVVIALQDKQDCNKYIEILSLLSTTYKVLYKIVRQRITNYAEQLLGEHPCGDSAK